MRGDAKPIDCDLLAVSGGWNPSLHLHSQSGGKAQFDEELGAFVPGESVQQERSVGGVCRGFDLPRAFGKDWPRVLRQHGRQVSGTG